MSGTKSLLSSGWVRWGAVAVLGGLGFVAFLSYAAGARLDVATGGLVVGGAALVFCLATLFKMVQVLSRPRAALGVSSRGLGGEGRSQLREEKRRLLRAIKELKFDFEMGKLSEPDFSEVKQAYELRAVEVMRALDGVKRVHPEVYALLEDRGLTDVLPEGSIKDARNAALARSDAPDQDQPPKTPPAEPPSVEAEDPDPAASAVQACGACSGANDPDAKFCKHCGKEISA